MMRTGQDIMIRIAHCEKTWRNDETLRGQGFIICFKILIFCIMDLMQVLINLLPSGDSHNFIINISRFKSLNIMLVQLTIKY